MNKFSNQIDALLAKQQAEEVFVTCLNTNGVRYLFADTTTTILIRSSKSPLAIIPSVRLSANQTAPKCMLPCPRFSPTISRSRWVFTVSDITFMHRWAASYGRLLRGRYHLANSLGFWQQCLKACDFDTASTEENPRDQGASYASIQDNTDEAVANGEIGYVGTSMNCSMARNQLMQTSLWNESDQGQLIPLVPRLKYDKRHIEPMGPG